MFGEEKLFERNVSRLDGLEMNQIRRLIKMYKEAKKQLTNNILFTPDNTFTRARMEYALEQVDAMIIRMQKKLDEELKFGFENLHLQGVEDSASEINALEKKFNGLKSPPVSIEAVIASSQPESFLFNQYQESIKAYNQSLRVEFQRSLGQSLIQKKSWSQAVFDMEQVFIGAEWRLQRLARTELHNIYNVSKLKGFDRIRGKYFEDLKKTLYHPMDIRTGDDSIKASKSPKMIVALDKPFKYTFKGKDRIFMNPPDRPNDRAILIPYRESYDAK
jgi:hypothetical protein